MTRDEIIELSKSFIVDHEDFDEKREIVWKNKDSFPVMMDVIFDESVTVNTRAHIAKMLLSFPEQEPKIIERICNHESSLIRLGAVIGLAYACDSERLVTFLNDPHEKVRLEAQESLDDLRSFCDV